MTWGFDSPFAAADLFQLIQPGVHGGVDVRRRRLEIALVVDQSGRIYRPHRFRALHEITAEGGFIAEGPHDDGGMVEIPSYHADGTFHVGSLPRRIIGNPGIVFHPFETVALQIRLVNHIEAVFVTQIVQAVGGRIMGTPQRVDIVLFHQNHIGLHLLIRDGASLGRTVVVVVDTI